MNRILLSFVCFTSLLNTVDVYSETTIVEKTSSAPTVHKTYGPITTYETLWSVSTHLRPNLDVSVYQTLMAIYKENPSAFLNGDINKIIINSVIKVPSDTFIAQQNNAEALTLLNINPSLIKVNEKKEKHDIDNPLAETPQSQPMLGSTDTKLGASDLVGTTLIDQQESHITRSELTSTESQEPEPRSESLQGIIKLSDLPSIPSSQNIITPVEFPVLGSKTDLANINIIEADTVLSNIPDADNSTLQWSRPETSENVTEMTSAAKDNNTAIINTETTTDVKEEAVSDVNTVADDTAIEIVSDINTVVDDTARETVSVSNTVADDAAIETVSDVNTIADDTAMETVSDVNTVADEAATETVSDVNSIADDIAMETVNDINTVADNIATETVSVANTVSDVNTVADDTAMETVSVANTVSDVNTVADNINTVADEAATETVSDVNTIADDTTMERVSVVNTVADDIAIETVNGTNTAVKKENAQAVIETKTREIEDSEAQSVSVAQDLLQSMASTNQEIGELGGGAQFEVDSVKENKNVIENDKKDSVGTDNELAILYEKLNTVTAANEVLKQKLDPLSEQIAALSNQLNDDANIQNELQDLIEQYKTKIEAIEEPAFNDDSLYHTILRSITSSSLYLLLAILFPLLLLTIIFLFILRRKSDTEHNEKILHEELNDDVDDLDNSETISEFDVLLSELTAIKDEERFSQETKDDITFDIDPVNENESSVTDEVSVLSFRDLTETDLGLEDDLTIINDFSFSDSKSEQLNDTPDIDKNVEDQQNIDLVADINIVDEPKIEIDLTSENIIESDPSLTAGVTSEEHAGGDEKITENLKADANPSALVAKVNALISGETSKDKEYIEIDYLLANNNGNEVTEDEFDLDFGLDEFPEIISASDFDTDADRISAQLDLARAYLEIDEKSNAKAILTKLLVVAEDEKLIEVNRLLARIS